MEYLKILNQTEEVEMLIAKCFWGLKILAIYALALVSVVIVCGSLVFLILNKFPNWTLNEMIFPDKKRQGKYKF